MSIVERLGGFWYCKGKAFIWIVQGFWKKSVEMEVIFNRCWVLEIQNEAFTNQSGSSTNHSTRNSAEWCVYLLNCQNIEKLSDDFDDYVKEIEYFCRAGIISYTLLQRKA